MRFTLHAIRRFSERCRLPLVVAESEAPVSFREGRMLTRKEAAARIGGPVYGTDKHGDVAYRSDGTGAGVWILVLVGLRWRVATYLVPGDQDWEAEEVAATLLAVSVAEVAAGEG